MPHVVVEGEVSLEELGRRFRPLLEREGDDVLKLQGLYRTQDGAEALLDTLVVESGHPQHFLIQVRRREAGDTTVRLFPLTDPEKTPGVKRALARVARLIKDLNPEGCRYGATNLESFLRE